MQALRKLALSYPDVEEGIACKGTALECATFKAKKKAFLFLTDTVSRLKLQKSLAEAAKVRDTCEVGANGWVKITLGESGTPTLDVLKRWIGESYDLMAPKKAPAKKKAAKK